LARVFTSALLILPRQAPLYSARSSKPSTSATPAALSSSPNHCFTSSARVFTFTLHFFSFASKSPNQSSKPSCSWTATHLEGLDSLFCYIWTIRVPRQEGRRCVIKRMKYVLEGFFIETQVPKLTS
ncbi:hypothetical protein VIGAN_01354300, partial [Vigna angularis var. angularis]